MRGRAWDKRREGSQTKLELECARKVELGIGGIIATKSYRCPISGAKPSAGLRPVDGSDEARPSLCHQRLLADQTSFLLLGLGQHRAGGY